MWSDFISPASTHTKTKLTFSPEINDWSNPLSCVTLYFPQDQQVCSFFRSCQSLEWIWLVPFNGTSQAAHKYCYNAINVERYECMEWPLDFICLLAPFYTPMLSLLTTPNTTTCDIIVYPKKSYRDIWHSEIFGVVWYQKLTLEILNIKTARTIDR